MNLYYNFIGVFIQQNGVVSTVSSGILFARFPTVEHKDKNKNKYKALMFDCRKTSKNVLLHRLLGASVSTLISYHDTVKTTNGFWVDIRTA